MSEFSSDGGQEAAGQYTPSTTRGLFTQIKDVSCSESCSLTRALKLILIIMLMKICRRTKLTITDTTTRQQFGI